MRSESEHFGDEPEQSLPRMREKPDSSLHRCKTSDSQRYRIVTSLTRKHWDADPFKSREEMQENQCEDREATESDEDHLGKWQRKIKNEGNEDTPGDDATRGASIAAGTGMTTTTGISAAGPSSLESSLSISKAKPQ